MCGGGGGGGLGSVIGTIAGIALAPVTGGASLAATMATTAGYAALGSAVGGAIGGSTDPLGDAVKGGLSGATAGWATGPSGGLAWVPEAGASGLPLANAAGSFQPISNMAYYGAGLGSSIASTGLPGASTIGQGITNFTANPMATMSSWGNSLTGGGAPQAGGTPQQGGAGGGGFSGTNLIPAALSIGSGVYGLGQAEEQRRRMAQLAGQSDPWAASGGRSLSDAQLQELMRDPGQVAARDPSYALRIQGAQRATAMMGQDSGAMAVAGANASTDWYNQRMAQLGGMAGAGVNPANAGELALRGNLAANDMQQSSLRAIGAGATQAMGSTGNPYMDLMLARMGR